METILSYITWNPNPVIVDLGVLAPRWYGLLFASGFLIGLFIVRKMFEAEKAPEEWLDKAFVYVVVGAVVGARLGHVFFYDWDYYSQNLSEIPMIWRGGLASHGGAIGIILSLWIFSRRVSKKSILWILDKVVVPTALAGMFIRLGNLMNSEIVGTPTEVSWGFIFVRLDGPDGPARHPVQLYEAISYLFSFFILFYTYWKTKLREKPGFMFGLFLVLIFGFRFIWEYFKRSQGGLETAFDNALTTGQILSIPAVLVGLYFVLRPNPKGK
jgi:phosphatidylglycerol---prolipoprotein diacylglyceryl transferase